jgi:hypothetical protein
MTRAIPLALSAVLLALAAGVSLSAAPLPPAPKSGSGSASSLAEAEAQVAATPSPEAAAALLDSLSASLPPSDAAVLLGEDRPALAPELRSRFLVRSGDLDLLLGLFGEAQARYEAASALAAGGRDPKLLLRAARCALAAGNAERAQALSAELLNASVDQGVAAGARNLGAWALLFQDRAAEARAVASAVAASSAIAPEQRREARFILWLCAEDADRGPAAAALASEFPGSPEALIAAGSASAPPLPHWYLGLGKGRPAVGDAKPGVADAKPGAVLAKGKRLQVGYFSVEDNARVLRDELSSKGFEAAVEERSRQAKPGKEPERRWIVIVDPGKDLSKTLQALKDKGYEAYIIEG